MGATGTLPGKLAEIWDHWISDCSDLSLQAQRPISAAAGKRLVVEPGHCVSCYVAVAISAFNAQLHLQKTLRL